MNELELYIRELQRLLGRIAEGVDGLDSVALDFAPGAPEANSAGVLATHVMGNAEAWVLGIVCGRAVERDRDAEFAARRLDAGDLAARARRLSEEIAVALRALPAGELDAVRSPRRPLVGTGPTEDLTVREALMRVLVHGLMHVGHLQVARDLALAARSA